MQKLKKIKATFSAKLQSHRAKDRRSVHDDEEGLPCALVSVAVATSPDPAQTHSHVTNEPIQTFPAEIHNKTVESGEVDIRELWDVSYERLRQENPELIKKYEDLILKDEDPHTALASVLPVGPMRREQMKFILTRKMEQVNRDAWKLKFGDSTEIEAKDIAEPVLKVVDKANDFITNALDGSPQASIAWAGVSLLLPVSAGYSNATYYTNASPKLLLNPSKQAASLAKGLGYISRLVVQSQLREDLYVRYEKQPADEEVWQRSHTIFKDSLEKLYRRILCLQAEAYCYYSSNSALRLVRDMAQWDDWEALLTKVQEQEQTFIAVNELFKDGKYHEECEAAERRHRETAGVWKSIGTDLSGLHKAIEEARSDQKRVELLDWLCKVDHSKLFNAARDRYQDGTNKWLIEDNDIFKQWETRPHSFLWLHGKAGSGKSIISSSVIEYIDERIDSETGLAYFFFSFTDPANQSTDIMLSSLIKQLCTARPNTPKPIENFRGRYKERGTRPPTERLEEALLAAATGFSSVYIVLDGLDECPAVNNERLKLLKSLDRVMRNSPSSIHVLCTSRNQPDIAGYMGPLGSTGQGDVIDLHGGVHRQVLDHDIGSYIESTLQSPAFEHFTIEIKKKVQDRLVENADGMFQYVYLQMDELRGALDQDSVSRALDNLPKGLDETYQRIFGAIDAKAEQNVRRILMWLAFERGTIKFDLGTLAELYAIRPDNAVAIEEGNRLLSPNSILKMMPGLIVTDSNGEIRIAHYSIQQYLLSSRIRESPAAQFAFSESEAHFFIGHSWLALHIQRVNGGSLPNHIHCNKISRLWLYHLNMVPHENWPENVKRKAISALAPRSKSMAMILSLHEHSVDERRRYRQYDPELDFTVLRQPQCFTSSKGLSNLTCLLLSDCLPGTNRYITRDDLDLALFYAAARGHIDTVEQILDMGADINAIIEPYTGSCIDFTRGASTALLAALYQRHLSTSELLLQRGADINARDHRGWSTLQEAANDGDLELVRFLLKHGADIDARDDVRCSALQAAISWADLSESFMEVVMLLYESGADHKIILPTAAVHSKNTNCLKVLLDKGTSIDQTGPDQLTALHKAAGSGDYKDAFDLLLVHGADVNATSEQHGTPLHQACLSGTVQCVISLLENGADLDVSCTLLGTALQAACRSRGGFPIMDEKSPLAKVRVLIDAGADVNAQGGLYGNALQAAAFFKLHGVVKYLLDKGANVNVSGGRYGTALQAACASEEWNDITGVKLLLEHSAEVNIRGGKYGCALQAACKYKGIQGMKLLLEHGADPKVHGGKYGCSLTAAATTWRGPQAETKLHMLMEKGADVNYRGGCGGTSLQAACTDFGFNAGNAEVLLAYGANASARTGINGTPLHAIFMHKHGVMKTKDVLRLIDALLQRGADINDTGGPGGITALQGLLERGHKSSFPYKDTIDRKGLFETIEYLLELGADPNIGGGKYGFPLQSACASQEDFDSGRAQRLLELCPKIDINAQGGYFHTSLQAAAYTAQTEPIRIMLERGVDVNARGGRYGSALNAAVVQGFWDIAKTLMEAGAKADCEIFSAPDQLWLWRLEEDDGRAAVRRYEKFWEVESGQETPVVSMLAWLGIE